jgi:predicted nucleic acid-binding protein
MSGHNIVADTSLLINFFNGSASARNFLEEREIWISGITEIELLSYNKLTAPERRLIKDFLKHITVVDLLNPIKEIAVELRLSKTLKLPDTIIAATSLYLDFPLFTYDKSFRKVKHLNVILLEQ